MHTPVIFIDDNDNSRIRKVDGTTGIISTVAGNGTRGFSGDGGSATEASIEPFGVFLDSSGNIFIEDGGNNRIRKVDGATGIISTVAGNGTIGFSGDGGPATEASINPTGVFLDSSGNIFIADGANNNRIRKVDGTTGIISTVVGNGTSDIISDGGDATEASLISPSGVFLDSSGNIFIADGSAHRIRKVTFGTQSPTPTPTVMPTPTVEPKNGKALLKVSFNPEQVSVFNFPLFNYSVLVEEVNGVGVTITSFKVDDMPFSKGEFVANFNDCGVQIDGVIPGFDIACFDVTDIGCPGNRVWSIFGVDQNGNSIEASNFIELVEFPSVFGTFPKANFTASPMSGAPPLTVNFTDISQIPGFRTLSECFLGIEQWSWSFGDGSTSNEQNPVHIYTEIGKFDVSLDIATAPDDPDTCQRDKPCGGNGFPASSSVIFEDFINVTFTPIPTPTPTVILVPTPTPDVGGKSFTFNCEHSMKRGFFFGLETLTMNVGDTENCTLKLTNREPGKTVEVSSLLKKGFRSAIKIEPARSVTDENGELEITITAIQKGRDWAAWAVPNDKGQFKFNKATYNTGLAWGMFVRVK